MDERDTICERRNAPLATRLPHLSNIYISPTKILKFRNSYMFGSHGKKSERAMGFELTIFGSNALLASRLTNVAKVDAPRFIIPNSYLWEFLIPQCILFEFFKFAF